MASVVGVYAFHKTSLNRETGLVLEFDFSQRHEIVAGATISSATANVMLNNLATTDMTVGNVSVVGGNKVDVANVADVAAVAGNVYHLVCSATLSNGAVLVEAIQLPVVLV